MRRRNPSIRCRLSDCHAVLLDFWFQAFSYRTLLTIQLGPHPVSQADESHQAVAVALGKYDVGRGRSLL